MPSSLALPNLPLIKQWREKLFELEGYTTTEPLYMKRSDYDNYFPYIESVFRKDKKRPIKDGTFSTRIYACCAGFEHKGSTFKLPNHAEAARLKPSTKTKECRFTFSEREYSDPSKDVEIYQSGRRTKTGLPIPCHRECHSLEYSDLQHAPKPLRTIAGEMFGKGIALENITAAFLADSRLADFGGKFWRHQTTANACAEHKKEHPDNGILRSWMPSYGRGKMQRDEAIANCLSNGQLAEAIDTTDADFIPEAPFPYAFPHVATGPKRKKVPGKRGKHGKIQGQYQIKVVDEDETGQPKRKFVPGMGFVWMDKADLELFRSNGHYVICDLTHRMYQLKDWKLFTIMIRDKYGRWKQVAHAAVYRETTEVITKFLQVLKRWCEGEWKCRYAMTDDSAAEKAAFQRAFKTEKDLGYGVQHFLCRKHSQETMYRRLKGDEYTICRQELQAALYNHNTKAGCDAAIERALASMPTTTETHKKKFNYVQKEWQATAELWANYAHDIEPLLLQIVTTNALESWHSVLKRRAKISKTKRGWFSLLGVVELIRAVSAEYDIRARKEELDWDSKFLLQPEYPFLRLFPNPVQRIIMDEILVGDILLAKGKPPRPLHHGRCDCKNTKRWLLPCRHIFHAIGLKSIPELTAVEWDAHAELFRHGRCFDVYWTPEAAGLRQQAAAAVLPQALPQADETLSTSMSSLEGIRADVYSIVENAAAAGLGRDDVKAVLAQISSSLRALAMQTGQASAFMAELVGDVVTEDVAVEETEEDVDDEEEEEEQEEEGDDAGYDMDDPAIAPAVPAVSPVAATIVQMPAMPHAPMEANQSQPAQWQTSQAA